MIPLALILLAAPPQFVAIPGDAWLYERPDDAATRHRRMGEGPSSWRFLEERGEWTHVASDFDFWPCLPSLDFPGVELQLWVKSSALLTVTTAAETVTNKDGTSVTVLPGVLVTRDELDLAG